MSGSPTTQPEPFTGRVDQCDDDRLWQNVVAVQGSVRVGHDRMTFSIPASLGAISISDNMRVFVLAVTLLVFMAIGLDVLVRPRKHMNSYQKRGGELLRDWNEMQIRCVGLVFLVASLWMLYHLARSIWMSSR